MQDTLYDLGQITCSDFVKNICERIPDSVAIDSVGNVTNNFESINSNIIFKTPLPMFEIDLILS